MQHAPPKKQRTYAAANAKAAGELFRDMVDKHGLTPEETLLMAVCKRALRTDIDHIAAMCRQARVSDDQIQRHGTEIGADKPLNVCMTHNIRKFVQFFNTMHNLKIIELKGAIHNRTLFGHQIISILHKDEWLSVLNFACDSFAYFGSTVTVYERLLDFGYKPLKYRTRTPKSSKPTPSKPKTPTQKKTSMLLHTPDWMFDKSRLDRNVKRYTNGHTKVCPLNLLVKVALASS